MHLSDYYAPCDFLNFLFFLLFFFAMDIVGNYCASLLQFPKYLRSVHWIFGLAIFIFIWFLLHFFIPFRQDYVYLSVIFFPILFVPYYIKNKGVVSLAKVFLGFPYPLIFLLLIAQKIFYLVSLPPYVNDELAYHYISPAEMVTRINWDFNHNIRFYYMLPKTMETAFTLMFSFTKTYAIARLLHFMIFFTSIYAISIFLKEKVNIFVAIVYSFFILFMFATPLIDSTRGYIDVAPAVLSNLLLVIIIDWLITKKRGYFYSIASLAGIIAGIKYTVLGYIASLMFLVILYLFLINYKKIKSYLYPKVWKIYFKKFITIIILSFLLFIIMGGYWYLKNFIVTNNPVYPFVFKCRNNIACSNKNEFFSDFGIQFKIENLPIFIQTMKENVK